MIAIPFRRVLIGRTKIVGQTNLEPAGAVPAGILLLASACLALGGCAERRSNIPPPTAAFNVQPDQLFIENTDYRLGPQDLLTVTVYRAPEVSGDFRVDTTGNIMMPLLGEMQVQGLTATELADRLKDRLGNHLYVKPDVSVAIKEAVNQRVTIIGSVNSPGLYGLPGRTTLMQAVALAKGPSGGANIHRVVVFRQIQGQKMAAAFDLRNILEARAEDPLVYASDIIVVDGSQTRQTLHDVLTTIPILALFRPFLY